jgi:hypothetical protein
VLRRAVRDGLNPKKIGDALTIFSGAVRIEGVHPLQFGFVRHKVRRERRYRMRLENPLIFYPRCAAEFAGALWPWLLLLRRYRRIMRRAMADPAAASYVDEALRRSTGEEDALPDFVRAFSNKIPRTYGAPANRAAAL